MSSDIAIKIENLSKCFQIYDNPEDRLKQGIYPKLRKIFGLQPKHYYREFWAIKDLSLEIKKGDTVGIIGRNGSGKSTLLQMICGTLSPTTGKVTTHGRIAALLELGAGFNGEFTGRENVYLSASLYGLTRDQIDQRFDQLSAFADIGSFIDQPVKTYSSGMFVRLAFAVIAHVEPDVLIIDEALAVGDAFFVQKCMRFLRDFTKSGTLIFVSHDVGAVLGLCQSAIWLHKGKLCALGSPKVLTSDYMQSLYEDDQHLIDGIKMNDDKNVADYRTASTSMLAESKNRSLPRDLRSDQINQSVLRNDIELFAFQSDAASFGKGSARIIDVHFGDQFCQQLSWIIGGETVVLSIECDCSANLSGPIVGFAVKDRLGQVLFGDNTWLSTLDNPLHLAFGERIRASFTFTMPRLPNGDYTISAAIAEGTAAEHQQHHWIHDALTFKVHSSSVYSGLVGIPMTDIQLRRTS
jgi:lipopolysaccharide transport system ATP-binding protein